MATPAAIPIEPQSDGQHTLVTLSGPRAAVAACSLSAVCCAGVLLSGRFSFHRLSRRCLRGLLAHPNLVCEQRQRRSAKSTQPDAPLP